MYRLIATLSLLASIQACRPANEPERNDLSSVVRCMEKQEDRDSYLLVTKCEPLGPAKEFLGTWFDGFEEAEFEEGYSTVPARLESRGGVELVFSPASRKLVPQADEDRASAYQIRFIGRKSLVAEDRPFTTVVVDRLISIREVPRDSNYGEQLR